MGFESHTLSLSVGTLFAVVADKIVYNVVVNGSYIDISIYFPKFHINTESVSISFLAPSRKNFQSSVAAYQFPVV